MKLKNLFILTGCLVVSFSFSVFSRPLLSDASATYIYKNEIFKCGFYEGTNDMPTEHLADGLAIAKEMRSMLKINIVMIGHSVPMTTFSGWNWTDAVKTQFGLAANTNFKDASVAAKMAWDWINQFKGTISSLGGLSAADIHVLCVQLTWAASGQVVIPMLKKTYEKGTNNVMLKSGRSLTPGAYIVRFNNGTSSQSHKVTIAK
jgi:hypothetical protein